MPLFLVSSGCPVFSWLLGNALEIAATFWGASEAISDRPPVAESSQMPLFLTLTNLATSATWATSERPPRGTFQTAPLYRAEIVTPMNTALRGGAWVPPLGRLAEPLPACVWDRRIAKVAPFHP
jgi:hypothetical protein